MTTNQNQSIMLIKAKRLGDCWFFDDSALGILDEPFVPDASQMIDRAYADAFGEMPGEFIGIMFSPYEFPGHTAKFILKANEGSGFRYSYTISGKVPITGWLCPTLLKYMTPAPTIIYSKFLKLTSL